MKKLFLHKFITIVLIVFSFGIKGFSQANETLSNLTSPTAVNESLLPNSDNTKNLGSSASSWKDGYFDGTGYFKTTLNVGGSSITNGIQLNPNSTGKTLELRFLEISLNGTNYIGFKAPASISSNKIWTLPASDGTSGQVLSTNGSGVLSWASAGNSSGDAIISGLTVGKGGGAISTNTAVGNSALFSNLDGFKNTANGYQTLYSNIGGIGNTANGYNALYSNTQGDDNTATGMDALKNNLIGFSNTANGSEALYSNTIGAFNTASGRGALKNNTSGISNTATGGYALINNTTADFNTATGSEALYFNTEGSGNTANGSQALYANTTGNYNTANGYGAMTNNTTGFENSANGYNALYSNTTGYYHTASGFDALFSNTTGILNTANGHSALYSNTTGIENTANGFYSLYGNTIGSYNTANGYGAGSHNDNNTFCTFIGYDADQSVSTNFANATALGNASRITASNQVRIGNSSVSSIGGYASWTNISDGRYKKEIRENVPGLEFINKLTPVTYHLDVTGIRKMLGEDLTSEDSNGEHKKPGLKEMSAEDRSLIEKAVKDKEQVIYTGFIAQDVETAAKQIGYDFSGVDKPQNESSLYGLRYAEFVVPLVKAVQELDAENEKLKMENNDLELRIAKLESIIGPSEIQKESQTNDGFVKFGINDDQAESILGQNIPNPFENSTIIPFRIPKGCNSASIVIAESVTGRIVTAVPITCSETHITIEAGNLASGIYSYSLYVDGRIIETKQMVIAK